MRTPLLLASVGMLVQASLSDDRDLAGCGIQIDGHFFNFEGLRQSGDGGSDYQVYYSRAVGDGKSDQVALAFNICGETVSDCTNDDSNEEDFAHISYGSG